MQIAKIEPMLGISAQFSTFTRCEKFLTGTIGVLAKQWTMSKLCSDKASIVELDTVTKCSRMPRINKEACFMNPIGKKTKEIDTLEAERRFCGDESALQ